MSQEASTFRRVYFYATGLIVNVALVSLLVQITHPPKTQPPTVTIPAASRMPVPESVEITEGKPVRVVVPRLGIDLPVGEGFFNPADASWTLGGRQAYYAMPTYFANDYGGNTLIYGHNNKHVFGAMKRAASGDEAIVYTDNGHVFYYRHAESEEVLPNNTDIFRYQGPPLLTIQTCTGNWSEIRLMSQFRLVSVTKSQAVLRQKHEQKISQLKNTMLSLITPDTDMVPILKQPGTMNL